MDTKSKALLLAGTNEVVPTVLSRVEERFISYQTKKIGEFSRGGCAQGAAAVAAIDHDMGKTDNHKSSHSMTNRRDLPKSR